MNAKLRIGDSIFMLNDEYPEFGCFGPMADNKPAISVHLYVEDVDAFFNRAVEAGAEITMPVSDVFWGDRFGQVKDPFGHSTAARSASRWSSSGAQSGASPA